MKVTFLTVMPSPYVQDMFAHLAADDRFDLRVLYMEQEAPDTYWGEQAMPPYAKVLSGGWFGVSGARIHINPSARREIRMADADMVVVVGYIGLTNQLAMRMLTSRGKPWVFWGEVPGLHRRGRAGRLLRGMMQRPLYRAAGVAGVGSHAVAAYRDLLGDRATQCVLRNIPYHCGIDEFEVASHGRRASSDLRFLYCGQLIHRKGVDLLIQAFSRMIEEGVQATLTLTGEGPLKSQLRAALSPEVASRVTFTGFKPVCDLPEVFAENDVFVLPSRHDGWGVVVNQAVASRMPVIATSAVGAANDLVHESVNGFRVVPGDAHELEVAMRRFVTDRSLLESYRDASGWMAQRVSLTQAANDWYDFLTESLQAFQEFPKHQGRPK